MAAASRVARKNRCVFLISGKFSKSSNLQKITEKNIQKGEAEDIHNWCHGISKPVIRRIGLGGRPLSAQKSGAKDFLKSDQSTAFANLNSGCLESSMVSKSQKSDA